MASKENQEALKTAFSIIYTCEELKAYNTLEKAIDDLELKDKALDILEHSKLFIGYKTKNGKTIRELLLDKARKELESEKQ